MPQLLHTIPCSTSRLPHRCARLDLDPLLPVAVCIFPLPTSPQPAGIRAHAMQTARMQWCKDLNKGLHILMTMQDVIEVLRSQQYDALLADCTALRANMQLHCCSHIQRECSLFTEGHKDMCSNTLESPEHVPSCDIESTQAIQVS
jgi:hypothetical protein